MSNNIAYKSSDVKITTLTLITPSGASVGLLHVMSELNIFEDLFSQTISGNIVINDSLNLINKLPIVGSEYILITFEKPGSTVSFKGVFRLYKITDRIRNNQQNETYIIHFTSEELLLSDSILVSKSYNDVTISSIVKNIATQYLGISRSKLPDSSIENTLGLQKVIIPNWRPLYSINWLAKQALSKHKGASFVWYEDREGFHFCSIESLMEKDSVASLKVIPKNSGETLQEAQDGIEIYEFNEAFDTLRNISCGMYAGQLISYDPLRRRIQTNTLKNPSFFDTTIHTEKNPFLLPSKDRTKLTVYEHTQANQRVYPMVSPHESIKYAQNKIIQRSNEIDKWMIQRDMYMANMHAIRMVGVMSGSLDMKVGKTVFISLPSSEEQEKGGKKLDELFSGKYIITALRHKINKKSYACIAEFSKDAITRKLEEPEESNTMKEIRGM